VNLAIEFVVLLAVTVLVYFLTVSVVMNIFEVLRRKVTGEPNSSVSGTFRDTVQSYKGRGR